MRSFVILSILTTALAAPVPALTSELNNVPGVSALVSTVGQAASPVTGQVPAIEDALDGITGSDAPGQLVNDLLSLAGNVKRSPITEVLEQIPGVSEVSQAAGQALSPVTSEIPGVLNTVSELPGGSAVSNVAETALDTLSSLKRRAITSVLNNIPGVSELTQTAGQVLSPVTGTVLPEVEQTLNGIPGGSTVVGVVNEAENLLANIKRDQN